MDNSIIKIVEYNVARRESEFNLSNIAKIIYVRKRGLVNDEFDVFVTEAINQIFDNVAYREVIDIPLLRKEVNNYNKGLFHIQYEPDTKEINLYSTESLQKGKKWPVYDIVFPLFIKSNGDGLDVVFRSEIVKMHYDWKDIQNANDFIQRLKKELVDPLSIIYPHDKEEEERLA
jgi:hypothetical protein